MHMVNSSDQQVLIKIGEKTLYRGKILIFFLLISSCYDPREDTTYQGPFLRLYETNCLDVAEISASGESKTT